MKSYVLGDTVYFAIGKEELVKGEVVHTFKHFNQTQYVVEYHNTIDYSITVRCYHTLSSNKEGPLNIWKRSAEMLKMLEKGL